jgi:uncharacterized FAD-dependent dehydrogenase
LEEFVAAGGEPDLLYKQKPHIGTDVLRKIVLNIRKKITENGGEILFGSKLTDLVIEDASAGAGEAGLKKISGVIVNGESKIEAETLILAIGHSARDTFRILNRKGVEMTQKPFSIGVRIEHPQALIDAAQYGENWEEYGLGAADYKLSYHCGNGRGSTHLHVSRWLRDRGLFPGGCVATNGMSYSDRGSALANSGLLVDVRTEDFPDESPLAGVEFQEKYEKLAFAAGGGNYHAPAQRLKDFMAASGLPYGRRELPDSQPVEPTYRPGITWTELDRCLPAFAVEAMREAIPVFGSSCTALTRGTPC